MIHPLSETPAYWLRAIARYVVEGEREGWTGTRAIHCAHALGQFVRMHKEVHDGREGRTAEAVPPMTDQPWMLDLFCGAGGAARGYQRAGFKLRGVDNKPQPHYCGDEFILADALAYLIEHGHKYDAIHASPPCQAFTSLRSMWNAKKHEDLLTPTRAALKELGKPYVIENVPGAPMENAIMLCGTMFGLGTGEAELRRHRFFDLGGFFLLAPPCMHYARQKVIGVYGGHGRDRRRTITITGDGNGRDYRKWPATVGVYGGLGGRSIRDGTQQFNIHQRREAMGIDWMTGEELSQAIPPVYTEFIGTQLLVYLRS